MDAYDAIIIGTGAPWHGPRLGDLSSAAPARATSGRHLMKNEIPVAGSHQAILLVRHGSGHVGVEHRLPGQLDNLYVGDTSVFPSIGAENPALTAMANALRVGEHLLTRLA